MRALLVRHASAGDRDEWEGDDRFRPLDKRGEEQAQGLADRLETQGVTGILSSPYVRCVDTVVPLAERLGLRIETRAELAEGASREAALDLLREDGEGAVHCTHGDVLELLLGREGEKGGAWLVELEGDELHSLEKI